MKQLKQITVLALVLLMLLALPVRSHAADVGLQETTGDYPVSGVNESEEVADYQDSGDLNRDKPTKEEIIAQWRNLLYSESVFAIEPSVKAPYATGQLTDSYIASGVSYLNYIRFVAGLPEVRSSQSLNENAQYGAVLLGALDQLTHYPGKPADMDESFYSQGYAATTSSNISMRYGYGNTNLLISSLSGCLADSGSNNLSTVGHRRWLLNPTLLNVGFGYAKSEQGASYVLTKVFDRSGSAVNYDFISWPASGYVPTNLFSGGDPWSITLNPTVYKKPVLENLAVTLTRTSDGATWQFDSQTGGPSSSAYAYMTVNNDGYGVANCIIFSPGSNAISSYTGEYTVEVTGIYTVSGAAATLRYKVEFFDAGECNHTYKTVVTPPTCTQWGYTDVTCMRCGENTRSNYVPYTGHSWGDWVQTKAPNELEDGILTRTCSGCGETETQPIDNNPFTDVKADRFETAILWGYYNGITAGTGDGTTFSPENACTRKQIVTFLWRAAGQPDPDSMVNPFTDVKSDRFEKAILWAYYAGITSGTGDGTTFSPENTCTRKQIVTFLWRYHGSPEPASMENPFTDVKADRFEKAILWGYYNGITAGTGDGTTFSPENPCTRKQIVTFLYRDLAE